MIKINHIAYTVLLIVFVPLSIFPVFSQQRKDIKYMAGVGAYGGYNVMTRSFDSSKGLQLNTVFTSGLSPSIGVFLNPRLILGCQIIGGFSSYFGSTKQVDSLTINYDQNFVSVGIAPFSRFFFQDFGNQIIPFIEAGVLGQYSLGFSKEKGEIKSSFDSVLSGNIGIGVSVFYTRNMSLEPFLRYTYTIRENSNKWSRRNIHDLTLGVNWQIFLSSLLPENADLQ